MFIQPNPYGAVYNVDLSIGAVQLTKFVNRVRIVNTVNSIYPIVLVNVNIEGTNIILQDLYGHEHLLLTLTLVGEDGIPKEVTEFKLLNLNQNLDLQPNTQFSANDFQTQPVQFTCIVLQCYQLMAKGINVVFEEFAGLDPLTVLQRAIKESGVPIESLKFDQRGKNTGIIEQICLPPLSVNKTIDYVHEKFGLYNGPLFKFCNINTETSQPELNLKDLSQAINDKPFVVIYQVPTDNKKLSDEIMERCIDDRHFFTQFQVKTMNYVNSNIINNRYKEVHIYHPRDRLFYNIPFTHDDIVKKYATSENKKTRYFKDLKDIETRFHTDLKGFAYENPPYEQSMVTSRLSEHVQDTFSISLEIGHNVKLSKLIQIGNVFLFEPTVNEYMQYRGKYIAKNVDVTLNKKGDQWETKASIVMFRSSQEVFPVGD